VHASGNREEAKHEIDVWFSAGEIYDYQIGAQKYVS